jgi:hypothetical protein
MENNSIPLQQGGVIREILSTPFIKDIIRESLKGKEANAVRPVVKTFIWEDPEFILSLFTMIPYMLNLFTTMLDQTGREFNEKFSPGLISDYMGSIIHNIDKETIRACASTYALLIKKIWEGSPELRSTVVNIVIESVPESLAQGINFATHALNTSYKKDPQIFNSFFSKMVKAIDGKEFKEATQTIACAVMDQKLPLLPWVWQLLKRRFWKQRRLASK